MVRARNVIYRFLKDTRGASAVIFALTLPVAVGFLALGSETALWFYKQRELQKIVDIAAYNGAVELSDSDNAAMAEATAQKDAIFHGFDALTGVLAVSAPPTSGAFQNANSVEVTITGTYPALFSGLFRTDPYVIAVRAVASFQNDGTACILALHPDASRAIEVAGSGDVDLVGCSVMSNSIADDAFYQGGNGDIVTPCVRAVGGIVESGGLTLAGPDHCSEPWPYSPAADDPFENLPAPTIPATCSAVPTVPNAQGIIDIPAGRYCGGMNLTGDYNYLPGVHVMDGGTWRLNASTTVTGTDVTFYLTNDADLTWNGTADINLTAPTTGTYAGVLVFADRDPNDDEDLLFNGTAGSALVGAIYAPGRAVDMLGDFTGSNGCTQLVASTITLSGNNTFSANCTGAGIGNIATAGRTRLVE
jgi:Flp pilus assembly protein TadG